MKTQVPRLSRLFAVPCEMGLHIRAASLLVKSMAPYRSVVKIQMGEVEIDGKSVMDVLTLGAMKGDALTFIIAGDDANEAMATIVALFDANFNE